MAARRMVKLGCAITKLDAIYRHEARRLTESTSGTFWFVTIDPRMGGRGDD